MNIQKEAQKFFSDACLAYTYAHLASGKSDFKSLTVFVAKGLEKGYLDNEANVDYPVQYINMILEACGKKERIRDVEKVEINSLSELPEGEYAVGFKYNILHFVSATNKCVTLDSWENSESVRYGKPVTYRRLIFIS